MKKRSLHDIIEKAVEGFPVAHRRKRKLTDDIFFVGYEIIELMPTHQVHIGMQSRILIDKVTGACYLEAKRLLRTNRVSDLWVILDRIESAVKPQLYAGLKPWEDG